MKEYKLVYLNKGIKFSREKDMEQAEEIINEYVSAGWELQQIVSPTMAWEPWWVYSTRKRIEFENARRL